MNTIFCKTKALVLFLLAILMTACLEKQFEPEEKETPPTTGETENGIPDDFDFSTKSTHELTVKVRDEYEGKRYYKVEVFADDPISNASARLIHGAKTNKNVPFKYEIVVPELVKEIFVRVTDPKDFIFVSVIKVVEGNLLLDYNATDTKKKSALRSAFDKDEPADYESTFLAGLKQAEEISGKNVSLKVNGTYKITDKNFAGKISFPNGKFTLYVGEGCELPITGQDKNINLVDGSAIYVLKGASIEANSAEIIIGNNAKILNAGLLNLKSIQMNGKSAELYNHPDGKINLSALDLNGGNVYNHCKITVSNVVYRGTGSNLFLRVNSSMHASSISFEDGHSGCSIEMKARAFLHVNKFHKQTSSALQIYGEAWPVDLKDLPLIQVEGDLKCSNILVSQNILLDTKGHRDGIVTYPGVMWLAGSIPTVMQGDCYDKQNNPDDKDFTEGSDDPVYDPETDESLMTYIYMFEDNWPGIGDYDMNDVVVNVGVGNRMVGNKVTTACITGQVLAVGAKKGLYLFAQIDGTDKVVNLLDGQEVHNFMGMQETETINTYKKDCESKSFNLDVDVTGINGVVNANNLNVFIVWGSPDGKNRNEVHVAGFYGTKNAAVSDSSSKDYKCMIDGEHKNLMWGLMIPKDVYSSYPKEGSPIDQAYPGFTDWAHSGGKNAYDWYTSGLEDKIFHP